MTFSSSFFLKYRSTQVVRTCSDLKQPFSFTEQEKGENVKPTGVMISKETHRKGTCWSPFSRVVANTDASVFLVVGRTVRAATEALHSCLFVCSLLYFVNYSRLKRFKVHQPNKLFCLIDSPRVFYFLFLSDAIRWV